MRKREEERGRERKDRRAYMGSTTREAASPCLVRPFNVTLDV